jgi:ABC-type uncharacterized transport system ATPase component
MTVIESLDYCIKSIENYNKKKVLLENNFKELEKVIKKLNNNILEVQNDRYYYGKAVEVIYNKSIGALTETINAALQFIMYDRNYEINLVLDDKRGTKTLAIILVDLDIGLEVDLKDGAGGGVRSIISTILKTYYLMNKNSYILILDEKWGMLSENYIGKFFEFMNSLVESKGFIVLSISHDNKFIQYGQYILTMSNGSIVSFKDNTKTLA